MAESDIEDHFLWARWYVVSYIYLVLNSKNATTYFTLHVRTVLFLFPMVIECIFCPFFRIFQIPFKHANAKACLFVKVVDLGIIIE